MASMSGNFASTIFAKDFARFGEQNFVPIVRFRSNRFVYVVNFAENSKNLAKSITTYCKLWH